MSTLQRFYSSLLVPSLVSSANLEYLQCMREYEQNTRNQRELLDKIYQRVGLNFAATQVAYQVVIDIILNGTNYSFETENKLMAGMLKAIYSNHTANELTKKGRGYCDGLVKPVNDVHRYDISAWGMLSTAYLIKAMIAIQVRKSEFTIYFPAVKHELRANPLFLFGELSTCCGEAAFSNLKNNTL